MQRPSAAVVKWLDGAAEAARRARHDPRDADALHDFRINARRLIGYVKIIEKTRGVPAKLRKRLRRALRATGPWRDAHIESEWMADYARRRSGGHGSAALATAFSRHCAPAPAGPRWWRKVDGTLKELRRAVEQNAPRRKDLFAAQSTAAEKEWRRLLRRLRRLDDVCDQAALHKARIAAKKLRYLLEALDKTPRGLPPPAVLRRLQTALGDVHDRDVIAVDVAAAGREAALASPRRTALARLAQERRRLLVRAKRRWSRLLAAHGE